MTGEWLFVRVAIERELGDHCVAGRDPPAMLLASCSESYPMTHSTSQTMVSSVWVGVFFRCLWKVAL